MDRHAGGALPPHLRGRPVSGTEAAHANEYFEHFLNATTLKNILGYHRSMCELLHLKPNVFPHFYPKLRACLTSWKAKALWKKFDSRISHKCYGKGKTCTGTRVLVIGAGPCGLRTAIEAQLLGAKVVVVEKRDRLSRNNVLHLWPFVIEDLRMLGAKKFFGKFCAGAIDHISIRQLQCVLLKVALLLGVELHTEVSFEGLIEPGEKIGWRAEVKPSEHPVAQYEFDVIIGADGKRNTLQGFKRKEFRGKLAIAITANFINKKTEAEARVEEISGVAFIFNQKFFKDLQAETRIDLENIVYYKDDTHYFVMTAKKHSLLEKGVIKRDLSDTEKLLAPDNVDRDALQNYAREAADFSTNYQLPELEFAVNHYGQPDVAMFDFTSMYAAEYASKVIERHGTRLLMILVGDSLLEPFWPTGSGCARGFLSSLDAAWAIRSYCSGQMTPLDVLAERESIYRLLAQTTPDNLNKDWKAYTLDPATRYPNLNKSVVTPLQTICLYDTDNPESIEKMKRASLDSMGRQLEHGVPKKRRRGNVDVDVVLTWLREQLRAYDDVTVTDLVSVFRPGKALAAVLHHYRPDLLDYVAAIKNNHESSAAQRNQLAMDIFDKELGVPLFMTAEEITNTDDFLSLTTYLTQIYDLFRGEIPHVKHPKLELPETSNKRSEFSFKTIKTTSGTNSRHKRHVVDVCAVKQPSSLDRKQRKRRTLDRIGPTVDYDTKLTGLRPPTNTNAEEDIASKIKSLEDKWSNRQPAEKKPRDLMRAIGKIETSDWNIKQIEKKILENKMGKPPSTLNMDKERVPRWSREEFKARQTKMEKKHLDRQESGETKYADIDRNIKQLDLKLREGTNRELGQNKVASITEKLVKKTPQISEKPEKVTQPKPVNLPVQNGSEYCHFCSKRVYLMERLSAEGRFFHHGCFKCQYCHTQLRLGSYMFDRDGQFGYRFYCIHHFGMHGELPRPTKVARKPSQKGGREVGRSPQKKPLSGVAGVDLLDRVQTPERIEFSNLSASGNISSDHEEPLSQMDEDEWTDKNFGASANELDDSEDDSSSLSDTDSDDEDAFDDALEQPMTREGTLKLAQIVRNTHRKGRNHSASDGYSSSEQSSYYENSSDDSDSDTATEGEDEIKARELRRREVLVEAPPAMPETETDTEMASEDETSTSESSRPNSATEISTDSEFAQDDATPTRERKIDDFFVTKRRGAGTASGHANRPKRLQITAAYAQQPLKVVRAHAPAEPPKRALNAGGYALNRTQSTGGIAAKVSLELKKKYLLGDAVGGGIQKSGSASALEVKFKSFHTAIEDCQRRLLTRKELPPPDLTRACLEIPRVEVHSAEEERKSDDETRDVTAKSGREEDRKEQEEEATSTSNRTEATTCRTNRNEADTSRTNRKEADTSRSNRDEETSSRTNWKEEETSRTTRIEDASSRISWKEGATGRANWKEADNTRTNREEETTERTNSNEEETPCRTNGREAETSTINWKEEESSRTNRDKEASSRINWNETETSRSNWKEAESSRTNWKEEATSTSNRKEADKEETSRTNEVVEEQSSTRKEEAVCSTNRKEAETDFVSIRKGAETGRNNRDEETLSPTNWNEAETSRSNRDEEASSRTSWNEDATGRTNWNEAETSRTNRKETRKSEKKQLNQPKSLPDLGAGGLRLACHVPRSSPEGETEQSDWAQDSFDSLELGGAQAHNFHPLATAATPHLDLDSLEYIDRSPPTANAAAAPPDDYRQHCQRLRGQVGFGNARDSLDLRKSRTKPDLLLLPPPSSTRYSKQRIERERDATRQVIEQMVMDKMKRLENETGRRKQLRNSIKPDLLGSPPLSVFAPRPPPRRPKSHTDETREQIETSRQQRTQSHPDEARNQFETQSRRERTDLHPHETRNEFETQPRQPRTKSHPDEALKQVETQSKQRPDEARKRIETPQSKQRQRPKSVQELKMAETPSKWCRSDSNLAEEPNAGGERRKSFGKMIAGIFYKKIAKFSPRSKSKSLTSLDLRKHEAAINEPRKCASQLDVQRGEVGEITPPPIPPLPANYTLKDESSDEGLQDRTSCDALDQSGAGNAELPSGAKRSGKSRRQSRQAQLKRHRMAQEIQRKLEETEVKMRELELRGVQVEKALRGEEEKEEEARDRCAKDENLLQEWFDLMRDRCELRRYERELTVRAQELELEDRHARLQNELREKLENCVRKTEDDVRAEQTIIDQMMDIVAKRDSLITVLEEDRLKYSHEDKDLEEQMLAKGLLLTPIRKSAGKID